MGFKAEGAVSPLEWDFRPYVDAHGVSPEPSGTALFAFQENYVNTLQAARRTSTAKAAVKDDEIKGMPAEQVRAETLRWAGMTWDEAIQESADLTEGILGPAVTVELHERIAALVDKVTKGCPNTDQIMALPGRNRTAFFGWFVGEVTNPEA